MRRLPVPLARRGLPLTLTGLALARSFFGTSGQTIDDIFKYLESEDRLGVVEQTLEWSHVAPTCPDTLCASPSLPLSLRCISCAAAADPAGLSARAGCYPFTDRDPFILHRAPHVYFIGNQPAFSTRLVQGGDGKKVRIVLVPRFKESGELVLVNTATLEVKVRSFEAYAG